MRCQLSRVLIVSWLCWWLSFWTSPLTAETVITVRGRINTDHAPTFNCSKLLDPILAKRKTCAMQSSTQVDICTVFAEDYHFLIPFVVHHLSLGFHKIHIYNNDMKSPWYLHPSLLCLSAADLITVVPWPGDGEFLNGLNHCHRARVLESRGLTHGHKQPPSSQLSRHLWMAIFDIDELLVLHQDTCVPLLVDKYPDTAQLAINWAMFVPTTPFSPYAMFGDPQYLTPEHRQMIDYDRSPVPSTSSSGGNGNGNGTLPLVILPHDMLFTRMKENFHIKSIARPTCVDKVESPHYMTLFPDCPYAKRTQTLAGTTFPPAPTSVAAERHVNSYPIAQLNHYWTTSVQDFMRKIHRGRGVKQAGVYRNSGDLPVRSKGPMVQDTTFHRTYGPYYVALKRACPECFDLSLIHDHQMLP